MALDHIKITRNTCAICDSRDLTQILDLPDFPLTGIFVTEPNANQYPNVDNKLLLCQECGHGQLQNIIYPSYIYDNTYSHRSSGSEMAMSGNDFFAEFLEKLTPGESFERVIDVGSNDLYLLKRIDHKGKQLIGIDPILDHSEAVDRIKIVPKFIEEIDVNVDLGGRPDLIVSAHTFEHIENPKMILQNLMEIAAEDALCVVEVPGFDTLIHNRRFDQVFHQHLHYFSLSSFLRLVSEAGGQYIAHAFNYNYWGGTLLVAIRKSMRQNPDCPIFNKPIKEHILTQYRFFKDQLSKTTQLLDTLTDMPIYGYGAAQMLPALAYHLKTDFSFLECVLDDNDSRDGLTYPHLPVRIQKPAPELKLEGAAILITALDSVRPILTRAISMNPRHIVLPLNPI